MKFARLLSPMLLLLVTCAHAQAPAAGSAAQPVQARKLTCQAVTAEPSDAERALRQRRLDDARRLFTAMPDGSEKTAGLIRVKLAVRDLATALTLAVDADKAHPNTPLLIDALGEVRFRRGELDEAVQTYNRALTANPCLPITHFDAYRFYLLAGLAAHGQQELETTHNLAPNDPLYTQVWSATHRVPPTPEERLARLERRAERTDLTPEQKEAIGNSIKALESRQRGDCQLAEPVSNAKIQLTGLGNAPNAQQSRGAGVDILFNGKRRRLELDTGAPGLSLTREAARSLGLEPEVETKIGGIGDEALANSFIAHVDDLRIGPMHFTNCRVTVFEGKNVLPGADGLMGADVFRDFLVTLDFPALEIRLAPLPKRPDDAAPVQAALSTGYAEDPDTPAKTLAETRRDRYVAPEMKDWTRIYRTGHDLIMPAVIGKAPRKLFILDTGAASNLISPDAAREVTGVSSDTDAHIRGLQGEVKNVFATGSMYIQFAGIRQEALSLTSIDTSDMSRYTGVEISGFIGYPTLKELALTIDYRDNLVHVTYAPHIGSNGR